MEKKNKKFYHNIENLYRIEKLKVKHLEKKMMKMMRKRESLDDFLTRNTNFIVKCKMYKKKN